LQKDLVITQGWRRSNEQGLVAEEPDEVNDQIVKLATQLATFGAPAQQALVPLLKSSDLRTSAAASYAIARFGPNARPAIPALGLALADGNGWAAQALAATKDVAAIPFLEKAASVGQPAAGAALLLMGPSGQRAFVEALARTKHPERLRLGATVDDPVWSEDLSALVDPLIALALDRASAKAVRIRALQLLPGRTALATVPILRNLGTGDDVEIAAAANGILQRMGAMTAEELASSKLLAAAEQGGAAADRATPELIEHARHGVWRERFRFVQALALIADPHTVPFLIEALASGDWRVTLAAERALGRLGARGRSAMPALARVEQTHWLPRVRTLAGTARAQIDGTAPIVPLAEMKVGTGAWSDLKDVSPVDGRCREVSLREADGWTGPRGAASYPVPGGILVGTDRGEWGGELRLVAPSPLADQKPQEVAKGNVFGIVPRPSGLLLLQGPAGISEYGTISRLERSRDGRWAAQPFLELPGGPRAFRLKSDGGLAIATTNGILTLDSTVAVQQFECQQEPQRPL
jgi:hypothetical protein